MLFRGRSVLLASACAWAVLLSELPPSARVYAGSDDLRVAQGTPWETTCTLIDSRVPGPTVLVVAGIHGDEPGGVLAADQISRWPISRGRLIVLPSANPPALEARSRLTPGLPEREGDLNRSFRNAHLPGATLPNGAAALWQWIATIKPDWLVDLHEGDGVRAAGSASPGSSVMVCRSAAASAAARAMLMAVNDTIQEDKLRFVQLSAPAEGSLARAAAERLGTNALLVATSTYAPIVAPADPDKAATEPGKDTDSTAERPKTRLQPPSLRSRQHRLMVAALLKHLDMADSPILVDRPATYRNGSETAWIAVYDAGGTGGAGASSLERLLPAVNIKVVRIGVDEVRAGGLAGFDAVIFPGGTGSGEAAAIGEEGRQQVERFIAQGGGYVGICAGAYLATSGFSWGLKLLDAKTVSPQWRRGGGTVKMELTAEGRAILGEQTGLLDVRYMNGPILTQAGRHEIDDYRVLAYFRTEMAKYGSPAGIMIGSPAIAVGRYREGRVVAISPHPEQTAGLEGLVCRAVLWAAGRK